MTLRAFVFALLATFVSPTEAGQIRWFDLERESYERVLVCSREIDAIAYAMVRATRPGDANTGLVQFLTSQDTCRYFEVYITYRRLVFRITDDERDIHTVYDVTIRGKTFFVPLLNRLHRTA